MKIAYFPLSALRIWNPLHAGNATATARSKPTPERAWARVLIARWIVGIVTE